MKDEIIAEIWKAKDAISAEHKYDVRNLVKHLRAEEALSGCRVFDLHARQHTDRRTKA
jgi:hypothetical protein